MYQALQHRHCPATLCRVVTVPSDGPVETKVTMHIMKINVMIECTLEDWLECHACRARFLKHFMCCALVMLANHHTGEGPLLMYN